MKIDELDFSGIARVIQKAVSEMKIPTQPVESGHTITYYAAAGNASEDNMYQFYIYNDDGAWKAYIRRTPDYGTRNTTPSVIHVNFDYRGRYVCIKGGDPSTCAELLAMTMLWADRTQRYIRTGKSLNQR